MRAPCGVVRNGRSAAHAASRDPSRPHRGKSQTETFVAHLSDENPGGPRPSRACGHALGVEPRAGPGIAGETRTRAQDQASEHTRALSGGLDLRALPRSSAGSQR